MAGPGADQGSDPSTRQLAVAISKLASREYVISPPQVASALIPLSQFQWLSDGSGGWVRRGGAFDGTAIQSAMLGYRRQVARDGTVAQGQMQAPWNAAYVSPVINMADGSCSSAEDVQAATQVPGVPARTPQDVEHVSAAEKSGIEFNIAKDEPIRKVLLLDRQCAQGIWLNKWNFNGEDLPIEPKG